MPKLTERQKRFCEEYLIDLNATQAAVRAGYRKKNARSTAAENLTKPNIQLYLQQLMQERSERTGITSDFVLEELRRIALADTEITGKEKMKALELLGKHLGLFSAGADNTVALEKLDEVLGKIEGNI